LILKPSHNGKKFVLKDYSTGDQYNWGISIMIPTPILLETLTSLFEVPVFVIISAIPIARDTNAVP
jgi:hypothetical protein